MVPVGHVDFYFTPARGRHLRLRFESHRKGIVGTLVGDNFVRGRDLHRAARHVARLDRHGLHGDGAGVRVPLRASRILVRIDLDDVLECLTGERREEVGEIHA